MGWIWPGGSCLRIPWLDEKCCSDRGLLEYIYLLGDHSPLVCHISPPLRGKGIVCVPGCLFKDICTADSYGRQTKCFPTKRRAGMIIAIRDSGSSSSSFLSCHVIHCLFKSHLALMSRLGNWGLGNWHICRHSVVGNKLSFISNLALPCFLSISMRLWQAKLLTCKWRKIQTLHNFWQYLYFT